MWNPFKKTSPAPPAASSGAEMPDNSGLITLIQHMKLDTLMGDMRPMHRAILTAELMLPMHEPPLQTPQGTRLRFMTFDDDTRMCAFTDVERMRGFLRDIPGVGTGVHLYFATGQELCKMASRSEIAVLSINPASDAHYGMPPHVYRVLEHGYVPASVADEEIHSETFAIARPMSGMPSGEELDRWRAVLREHGAQAAYWFNILLDDVMEVRYGIGVECDTETFEKLHSPLVGAWYGIWPVNTPLYVQHLTDNEGSQAIRQGGAPIYP